MDAIKAEIARKKRQIEESKVLVPNKQYFKRGDLSAVQEEEYWKKHKRLKSNDGEEEAVVEDKSSAKEQKSERQVPRKEVVRRLRERNEPIRLFAETDAEAYERLKKLEMSMPEINKGFKNDFKLAMDAVDQEYLNDMLKNTGEEEKKLTTEVTVKHDGTTYEEIMGMLDKFGQGDNDFDQELILRFLKLLLKLWGEDLNTRSQDDKLSLQGKMVSATHRQTVEYIKPLMRRLKKKELDQVILECLVDVVKHMLNRHYIKANDAYLEMAIGNAPWPIGVTMVGIHARTGREKISARNVAHVLNDETQRKYIQAVKRLMTQAMKYFPTDPSFMPGFEPKPASSPFL